MKKSIKLDTGKRVGNEQKEKVIPRICSRRATITEEKWQ
jgi:hypothetical protein